ncbi:MAG: hypothetical protein V3V14_14135 [Saprospiraceae bacterium]
MIIKYLKLNYTISNISIFILFIILLGSCRVDKSQKLDVTIENLYGKWDIIHATRNEKETKSIETAYFVFQDDNSVKTNLFGSQNSYTFVFDSKTIDIESPTPLKMKILKMKNDTLELTSKIGVFDMKFILKKGIED